MQAVILAAGLSSRLKDMTKAMPKGFVEMEGVAIVESSIKKLLSAGISEIIIGVGHCDQYYEELAKKYQPFIKTCKNENYANTSSMATLEICRPFVKGDFLLLESDLIYDSIGLEVLINDSRKNVVLISGQTKSGDEVYIGVDDSGRIIAASKDVNAIKNPAGELVGVTKLSLEALEAMICAFKNCGNIKADYESIMAETNRRGLGVDIYTRLIKYYVWCEIDDDDHLRRAKAEIYPRVKENELCRQIRREVLLNPGPATTTDSVKYAQVCPDICPRETEFGQIMQDISKDLSEMVGGADDVETVLFGGSGTLADEAMVASCVGDGKLLIVDNGAYGSRMADIAQVYKLNFEVFKSSSSEAINIDLLKECLIGGKFTHLAIVYHETTTGLLNPIREICKFCKETDITTLVDAVSAFCAISINLKNDGIDFMTSTSNKNIGGMAGIAFVFCRKEALEKIKDYPKRSYYSNLWDQYLYFKKNNQFRFTPPVQTIYALKQAVLETKLEGIEARYKRYCDCWVVLVQTLDELGLKMLLAKDIQSKMITAVVEPASTKYNFEIFHDECRRQGFTIYPGKLSNANTFRIANIGDIKVEEMRSFCKCLAGYIKNIK
jgi:2-aminoethylphosphonate-pyruvate transaminase